MGEETKRRPHWSTREKTTALVLVLVLGLFVNLLWTDYLRIIDRDRILWLLRSGTVSRKRSSQHHLLDSEFSDEHYRADFEHRFRRYYSHGLLRQELEWSGLLKQQLVGTDHQSECYQKQHSADRWKHVHIPIRFLIRHHADYIAKQRIQPYSQSLAQASSSQVPFYHATNNSRSPCNLLLLAK